MLSSVSIMKQKSKREKIDFSKIGAKWQKRWEDKKIFEVKLNTKKKKFYVLDMFPYPSGAGLHMGHAFVFSLGDIFARFKRMQGFNVLYPIGYDALGLPAENAAIKVGEHPEEYTKKSIKNFMNQQKAMGWSYDWSRLVNTSDPEYYKWEQWVFLKMFEKGIAYRKKAPLNWCPKCNTVLANEQVVGGKCWRHEDTEVEIKHFEQWFLKTTDYAEELLEKIDNLEWPEKAKTIQKNWIGKSEGTEIEFEIEGKPWKIFTTRPDTIFGVTFMVVSAQHERLPELVKPEQKKEVDAFLKKLGSVSEKELEKVGKEGVFTGSYATNPLTREKIPVYAGNFVIADYGSGMVMAVPAHDQRDFEFAEKYDIPVKVVVEPKNYEIYERKNKEGELEIPRAYSGEGFLVNSGDFNEMESKEARKKIRDFLVKKGIASKKIQFKLRDWSFSRQRYWGTPIPVVYCEECGVVPVPEKDLPVKLPKKVKFGKGNPLATNKEFLEVKCPKCAGKAKRETDTMDTFVNSSWYYLRYTDPHNNRKIFDSKKVNYWAPIDQYIGGPEHISMHLIYMRFYTKVLRDLGLIEFDEPALRYFTQGVVKGSDGNRMSKSRGNVVEPLETIKKYGADSLRLYLVSASAPDSDFDWDEKGMQGSHKFIQKVYNYFSKIKFGKATAEVESKVNKTIKDVTSFIESFKHNLAVIELRKLFDFISSREIDKKSAEIFLKMLHVYAPFVTEELWGATGNRGFISLESWPSPDEKKINEKFEQQEKAVEKLVEDISHIKKMLGKEPENVYVYVLPNELDIYKNVPGVKIFAVNDKNKYDPENKSKKVKPGRPGVYLE